MFTVTIRDRFVIAHSFRGETFGPARAIHGATYITDVRFQRATLDAEQLVVDIDLAAEMLRDALSEFQFKNLDEVDEFSGINTTTAFLARVVFDRLAARIASGELGETGRGIERMRVTLQESDVVSAAYERDLLRA